MHGTFALLPPSPFIDLPQRLETARTELLEAQFQLARRRVALGHGLVAPSKSIRLATTRLYQALDAVWSAQGERNIS